MTVQQHNMQHYRWPKDQPPGTEKVQGCLLGSGSQLKKHTANMTGKEIG